MSSSGECKVLIVIFYSPTKAINQQGVENKKPVYWATCVRIGSECVKR